MQRAGEFAFQQIQNQFPNGGSILVLCGSGNNGGDGYILANSALKAGWSVEVVTIGLAKTDEAQTAYQQFLDTGGKHPER